MRPESFRIMNLPRPQVIKQCLIDDMLTAHPAEDIRAHADKFIIGIEIIEGGVFGDIELLQNQPAHLVGAFRPAIGLSRFAERLRHIAQGQTCAIGGGGQVRAQARQGEAVRIVLGVLVRALRRDAFPARRIVMAGIIGAETFGQASAAGIAIFQKPGVPGRTGGVSRGQQAFIIRRPRQFPGRGGDRHHHLDLTEARLKHLVIAGQLAIHALQFEEGHVAVARHVRTELAVNERFMRPAFHPDAGIVGPLDQHGAGIARHHLHIGGQHSQRLVIGRLPLGIGGRELRLAYRLFRPRLGNHQGSRAGGDESSTVDHAHFHAWQASMSVLNRNCGRGSGVAGTNCTLITARRVTCRAHRP